MDSHKRKVIWITNEFEQIPASTMRRFSYTLEFKRFNDDQRLNVLNKEIKKRGFENYFTSEEIADICRSHSVNAGGIINAINMLEIDRNVDKRTAIRKIRTVLQSYEKVTTMGKPLNRRKNQFERYSLQSLNCSVDPEKVISMLKNYIDKGMKDTQGIYRPMSVLLYGIPGTGKSEFVYYAGHSLKKDIHLKRCSDIISMYVGETEKNIADAFNTAAEENRILFFDEADSFLFSRKYARTAYERSFTNEILTQMENYTGIVFFATNDLPVLDTASIRRFKLKIEFSPLTPNGALEIYKSVLYPLVKSKKSLSRSEIEGIRNMRNLTPGDFAVVRDQYSFSDSSDITHGMLINSLYEEIRYKAPVKKQIGFGK